jgi:hypothetical protein
MQAGEAVTSPAPLIAVPRYVPVWRVLFRCGHTCLTALSHEEVVFGDISICPKCRCWQGRAAVDLVFGP